MHHQTGSAAGRPPGADPEHDWQPDGTWLASEGPTEPSGFRARRARAAADATGGAGRTEPFGWRARTARAAADGRPAGWQTAAGPTAPFGVGAPDGQAAGDGRPGGPTAPVPPVWPPGGAWRGRGPGGPLRRLLSSDAGTGGPLRRSASDRLAGGVAAGVAARTGLDVTVVRLVFVVAAMLGGVGAVAYVLGWLLMPAAGGGGTIATRALADRRGLAVAAALGSLLIALLIVASLLGAGWLNSVAWAVVLCACGLVLIARNASADEQASLRRLGGHLLAVDRSRRSRIALRVLAAALLLLIGLVLVARPGHLLGTQLAGVTLVLAAIVIVLGPWWLRIARDLVLERQARVRAEERADLAARVHDSVLQTLALIQRRAGDPQQVVQLARAQERELRSWLFDGQAPGSLGAAVTTVAAGVRQIQQEVEARIGIVVEAVTVGDCELDEAQAALLAAAREAAVNAATWSGAPVVSLFAEVEPAQVALFVRDRGRGFDPAAVPADRKGLAESVRARVERRGGSVVIRTSAGTGTEVALTMPRSVPQRPPGRA